MKPERLYALVFASVYPHYVKKVETNNPGKLAAWISASHVEKAPKKKDPQTH